MIILDTSILSELLRPTPNPRVTGWLTALDGMTVYLTAITEAEIHESVACVADVQRRAALTQAIDRIFADDFAGRILPFDSAAASSFARIAATRSAAGRPIAQADAQIAAIAHARAATLATRNTPDFADCGIDLINPWNA